MEGISSQHVHQMDCVVFVAGGVDVRLRPTVLHGMEGSMYGLEGCRDASHIERA